MASASTPITMIVSKSEPDDQCQKLSTFGINAVPGEAGTDYVWFPNKMKCGIERKTVSNLLGSLADRQLVEQVQRGVKEFNYYAILIEGDYREDADGFLSYHNPRDPRADHSGWAKTKWRFDAIMGMLFDFQLLGVILVQCKMFDSARKIAMIASTTSAEHHSFMRERQRPDLPITVSLGGALYEDAVWALCALDGCGPEIAQALLSRYGTLAATIGALSAKHIEAADYRPENVLVKGKKLGAKRAARIRVGVTEAFK